MTVINPSVVNLAAHKAFVRKLALSDDQATADAAFELLASPPAMAVDYVTGFAPRQAKNHKLNLVDILGVLDSADLEALRKELPKDCPERQTFLDCLKSVLASAPVAWTMAAAGTVMVGSKANQTASKCTLITGSFPNADGTKPTDHVKGLKFWRVIAGMSQTDRDALSAMIADADRQGWK